MWSIVLCVLCLNVARGYGDSRGVGAYSFSDPSGRRYGGTYDVRDGQVVGSTGNFPSAGAFPVPFADAYQGYGYGIGYGFPGDFFPAYFANLDGFLRDIRYRRAFLPPLPPLPPLKPLTPFRPFRPFKPLFQSNRRAFDSNVESQKLAFNAARKAFDLTSFQADYIPNFASRLQPFNDLPAYGDFRSMSNLPNSAYASAAAGPGFSRQVAAINPANVDNPNVDTGNRFSEPPAQGGGFYSVSSKSFSSSSNVNGEEQTSRGAETVVNDNGKVTKYKVES